MRTGYGYGPNYDWTNDTLIKSEEDLIICQDITRD
jgi:hypothetical protein